MIYSKLKASMIHFGLSVLLVGLIIGTVLFFWFPQLFIAITDFKEVASIIILVDLVLGPLLTFIVFQPKKKTLKFDLSIVAAIQISALIYGVYTLYLVHPVFITFNIDRFTLVSAKDVEPEKARHVEYKVSKLSPAKMAFVKMPEDTDKRNELALTSVMGGRDLDKRIEYYEPYKNNIIQILDQTLDPNLIFAKEKSNKKIKKFLEKHEEDLTNYVFLPLTSATKVAILVLDKKSAQPVTTIDIDPWELAKK